jgi:acetyl-CoA C-acetyltransferase
VKEVVIVSAVRTPIGAYCGILREVAVEKLAALVLNEAVKRAKVKPEEVDEVVMSQSYQNGEAPNLARRALLDAGWPIEVPGFTIDRRCTSGVQAVWSGAQLIMTDYADIVVVSGAESMSRAEFYVPGDMIKWGVGGKTDPKWGFAPRYHGNLTMWGMPFYDRISRGRPMHQPIDRFGELNSMMVWADTAAKNENISRETADKWALRSHERALAAIDSGRLKDETLPVTVPGPKGDTVVDVDETPRRETTLEKLAKLKPVYKDGTCTAGNSSSENDGAAAVVLMSAETAAKRGLKPMAYLKAFGVGGADPALTYPSVPVAVNKALKRAGLNIKQIDLVEIQEAFATQALADGKLMGLSPEEMEAKVNVNGSGISLGHPIGATGVARLTTLLYEMNRRGSKFGLETICGGGGLGICVIVERK